MAQYRFESSVEVTEEVYVLLHGFRRERFPWKATSLTVAGVVAAVWSPWPVPGGLAAVVGVLGLIIPELSPYLARRDYSARQQLHSPITCGISDTELWVNGRDFETRFPWSHMSGWREHEGWIWIGSKVGAVVYLPVNALKDVDLYTEVRRSASSIAPEGRSRL